MSALATPAAASISAAAATDASMLGWVSVVAVSVLAVPGSLCATPLALLKLACKCLDLVIFSPDLQVCRSEQARDVSLQVVTLCAQSGHLLKHQSRVSEAKLSACRVNVEALCHFLLVLCWTLVVSAGC